MSQDSISGPSSLVFPELTVPAKQTPAAESTTSFDEHLQRVADQSRASQPPAEPASRESAPADLDEESIDEQGADSASQQDTADDARTEESSAESVTVRDDKTVEDTQEQEIEDVVEIEGSEVDPLIEATVVATQQPEQDQGETAEENEIDEEAVGQGGEVNTEGSQPSEVHRNRLNPTDVVPSGVDSVADEDIVKVEEALLPEGDSLQSAVATDKTASQVAEDVQIQSILETEILEPEKQATTPQRPEAGGNTGALADQGVSQITEEAETAASQTTDSSVVTTQHEETTPFATSGEVAEEDDRPLPVQQEPTEPQLQSTEPQSVASKPPSGEQTAGKQTTRPHEKQSQATDDGVAATNTETVANLQKTDVTTEDGADRVDRVGANKTFSRGPTEPVPLQVDTPSGDNRTVVHRSLSDASANTTRPQVSEAASNVRFVQRVAGAFRAAQDRGGEVQLRLRPPELGSLRVELTVKNGTLTARLEAETQAARTTLLDNLPALRDRLAEQNIKVDRFDVDVREESSRRSHDRAGDDGDGTHRQSRESSDSENDDRSASARHITEAAGQITIGVDDTQLNVIV